MLLSPATALRQTPEMGGGAGSTLDMQGQSILEEIAQVTGGKAFFPRSAAELEDARATGVELPLDEGDPELVRSV